MRCARGRAGYYWNIIWLDAFALLPFLIAADGRAAALTAAPACMCLARWR